MNHTISCWSLAFKTFSLWYVILRKISVICSLFFCGRGWCLSQCRRKYLHIYFLDFKNLMRGTYFKLGAYSSSLGDCNVRVFFSLKYLKLHFTFKFTCFCISSVDCFFPVLFNLQIVASLLLFIEEEDAFWLMCTVVEDLVPTSYYSNTLIGVQVLKQL